ncbi:MAG: hypothetical protein KDI39_03650 [Pseudomonadales bacterium]|nr:hypothetical protein [Pseudomonadales bacterium]
MKIKHILISVYLGIGVLFGLYGSIWGQYDYKGVAYNMGRGLMWPVVMFPSLGQVVALIVIVGFIAAITLFGKKG